MAVSLQDAIDIHIHAGPELFRRIGDAAEIAQRAKDAGMAGVAYKCHHESTVTRAYFAERMVEGIQVFGGITLNGFVGGINPIAVKGALDSGAKIVWMPTMHARNHIAEFGAGTYGISSMTLSEGATDIEGITVLDDSGQLTPETEQIIRMVADANAVLMTSHLGADEIRAVVRRCTEIGARSVLTHAYFLPRGPLKLFTEVADLGAVIELSAVISFPMAIHQQHWMTLQEAKDLIDAVGYDRVVISTDSGQPFNPWPPDALQMFVNALEDIGVPETHLRHMITVCPRQVLGIL
ncbi:MAG: DUF6282 family protein [Thermomicrobiales bacterium]